MEPFRVRTLSLAVLVAAFAATAATAQTPAVPSKALLTPEEMEAFLLKARIVSTRSVSVGVTDARRATLSDGTTTHDAQIQTVDVSTPVFQAGKASEVGFKDSYRFNIAGYRLARMLGLDSVPMSVKRVVEGKTAAVTWWIDDVMMDEKARTAKNTAGPDPVRTTKQIQIMRVFDELIQNRDRNQGNLLWTTDWKMWMIDHTRAFRIGRDLLNPDRLTRVESGLLARMRGLTADGLTKTMGEFLTQTEATALLARRDRIVKHFDDRIAKLGEAAVLYALESPALAETAAAK